jgi:hypothetical protein
MLVDSNDRRDGRKSHRIKTKDEKEKTATARWSGGEARQDAGDSDGAGLLGDGDGAGSADMCGFCCVDPSVGEEGDDLKHLWYRLFLRTGTKVPLVPVRNNNRYQRCFRNSSALLIFLLTFRTGCLHQPVPKVFFFFI